MTEFLATLILSLATVTSEDCLKLKPVDKMMACFKEVADAEYDAKPPPKAADPLKMGKWRILSTKDEMDDSVTVSMAVEAESEIEYWPNSKGTPMLGIRCKSGKIEMMLNTGAIVEPVEGRLEMKMRVDDGPVYPVAALHGTGLGAYFFVYNSSNIVDLFGAKVLRFEFRPINTSPVVAKFNVTGIEEAYRPVIHACKEDYPNWPTPTAK